MISVRIGTLVGDGVEIAALAVEEDENDAAKKARAGLVTALKTNGVVAVLRAIADGAATLRGLEDAIVLSDSEKIELDAVVAAVKLAAYRLGGHR